MSGKNCEPEIPEKQEIPVSGKNPLNRGAGLKWRMFYLYLEYF